MLYSLGCVAKSWLLKVFSRNDQIRGNQHPRQIDLMQS